MICRMNTPITPLHTFGFDLENKLKDRIELALDEPLNKTASRFAQFDFYGENYFVELKCRQKNVLPNSYNSWLLPTSKVPTTYEKQTIFFYYFASTDELYYLFYDEQQFAGFEKVKPAWHPTRAEHFLTPRSAWIKFEE